MFLNWSERSILSIAYFLSNNSTFSTTVYEKTSSMSGIYYAPAFLPKQVSSDIFRRKTIISAVKYFRNTYLWFDLEWHNFLTSFLSFNRLSLEKKKRHALDTIFCNFTVICLFGVGIPCLSSRYVQWIPIVRPVTSFRRRKK